MLFTDAFGPLQTHVEVEFCVTLYLLVLKYCKYTYLAEAAYFGGHLIKGPGQLCSEMS